ncbi:hypothetical protein L4C33_13965 [Vibrio makurazakiensis]|uniref:hypothetical protein n=1 Tax=Vibrio makurazakiensis TaxID=2910250 RepID=UPI003D129ED2
MTKLRLALLLLFIGVGILLTLTSFPVAKPTGKELKATALANTLTQSLDGQRRYLTLQINQGPTFRVSIPIQVTCPVGSTVYIEEFSSLFSNNSYRFVRCFENYK